MPPRRPQMLRQLQTSSPQRSPRARERFCRSSAERESQGRQAPRARVALTPSSIHSPTPHQRIRTYTVALSLVQSFPYMFVQHNYTHLTCLFTQTLVRLFQLPSIVVIKICSSLLIKIFHSTFSISLLHCFHFYMKKKSIPYRV